MPLTVLGDYYPARKLDNLDDILLFTAFCCRIISCIYAITQIHRHPQIRKAKKNLQKWVFTGVIISSVIWHANALVFAYTDSPKIWFFHWFGYVLTQFALAIEVFSETFLLQSFSFSFSFFKAGSKARASKSSILLLRWSLFLFHLILSLGWILVLPWAGQSAANFPSIVILMWDNFLIIVTVLSLIAATLTNIWVIQIIKNFWKLKSGLGLSNKPTSGNESVSSEAEIIPSPKAKSLRFSWWPSTGSPQKVEFLLALTLTIDWLNVPLAFYSSFAFDVTDLSIPGLIAISIGFFHLEMLLYIYLAIVAVGVKIGK